MRHSEQTLIQLLRHIPKPYPFKIIYATKTKGEFHPDSLVVLHDARRLTPPTLKLQNWFMNHTTAHRKRKEIDYSFYEWVMVHKEKEFHEAYKAYRCDNALDIRDIRESGDLGRRILAFLNEARFDSYDKLYGDWLESPQLREHLTSLIKEQNR